MTPVPAAAARSTSTAAGASRLSLRPVTGLTMDNREIAAVFLEIADRLQSRKDNWFKVRAYRRAADSIESADEAVAQLAAEGRLGEVVGVGEAIAKKIGELAATGRLEYLERLKAEASEEVG